MMKRWLVLGIVMVSFIGYPAYSATVGEWQQFRAILEERINIVEGLKELAPVGDKGVLREMIKKENYGDTDCIEACERVYKGVFPRLDCQSGCVETIWALNRQRAALRKVLQTIDRELERDNREYFRNDYIVIEKTYNTEIGEKIIAVLPHRRYVTQLDLGIELRIVGGPFGACIGFNPEAVKLSDGKLWVRTLKEEVPQKASFSVYTPTVVTSPRGTEYTLEIDKQSSTMVIVMEGEVSLYNRITKKEMEVVAGEVVTVKITGEEGDKEIMDLKQVRRWWDEKAKSPAYFISRTLLVFFLVVVVAGFFLAGMKRKK